VPKIFRCQDSQWGDPTIKSWWEKQTGNGVYHQWWLFHRGKWMIMMIHPQKLGYPTFRPKNCNSVSCVNNWLHPNSARSSLSLSFLSVQARIWWDWKLGASNGFGWETDGYYLFFKLLGSTKGSLKKLI
jgi:hypothetical protein